MRLGRNGSEDTPGRWRLDDATAEALIAGDTGADTGDLAGVSAFLHELRALGEGQPPTPSPALARMLAGEPEPRAGSFLRLVSSGEAAAANHPAASNGHRRPADAGSRRPSAGVVAKAAVIALVATAGVTGAAAARLLPEPAQKAVSRAIETVSPFEVPGTRGGDAGGGADEAMSRLGEPFDPGDGDGAAAGAGDPTERRNDQSGDPLGATERVGDRTRSRPAVGGDRSQQRPSSRPGPAVPSGVTTTSPAPSPSTPPSPAPGPGPSPAPGEGDGAGPAPAPPAGGRTYTATLRGNTDPARPGDPFGSGQASVTVHLGRELLCVAVTTSGTAPVTSVHVHEASATSTEPIVTAPAPAGDGSPACFGVDRRVLSKIRTDPAGHYVEVHNAEYPDGALRGSLEE